MDSTIMNIRVLSWRFQIDRQTLRPAIKHNGWHREKGWPEGYFSVYRFLWYRS